MSNRNVFFALTLVFTTAAIPAVCQAVDTALTQEHEVRERIDAAEKAVGQAIVSMDFSALSKLWSPRMLVNSPGDSVLTREDVFRAMRENYLKYSKYENTVESFRVYSDVAVVMGHELVVQTVGPDAGKVLQRRYTDMWQQTGGAWVQIARQATYIRGGQ